MKKRNERGALIVEASIVFPIMFLVIFVMLYTGNAYLQKCRVESIINKCALDAAAYCADPQLKTIKDGKIPTLEGLQVYPYRQFSATGVGDLETEMENLVYEQVTKLGTGYFNGMKPIIKKSDIDAEYHNAFLYATFSVDATYKIEIPVRLLGEKDNLRLSISTHVEMPVSDSVEMIRNTDMVWDYMERFGVAEKINEAKAKLEGALDKVNDWFDKAGAK